MHTMVLAEAALVDVCLEESLTVRFDSSGAA